MDKFRALEYLVASADAKSFSGAARRLKVSVTAVANLVAALESQLGVRLVERSSTGLTLTGAGSEYVDSGRLLLQRWAEADEQASAAASRSRGTVVLGIQHVIARECLAPALPRFHARYPEIKLDVRDFSRLSEAETSGIDVFVVLGWPQAQNLVHRRVGAARFVVLASPAYWEKHGVPKQPQDLAEHSCLLVRAIDGTAMDLWSFERDGVQESVTVSGWLVTSNAHRDTAMDLALSGEGVVRALDWTSRPEVASGSLVPVLTDWQSPEAPPVNLLYRASVRRTPRVRRLIDFIIETMEAKTTGTSGPIAASDQPVWLNRRFARASAVREGLR
jgi:LysR family transcriptional regulator for bpeEF and oprC